MSLFDAEQHKKQPYNDQNFLTVGRVVDTNDPQQMGRVRALCPGYGDSLDMPLKNVLWCSPVQPLAGLVNYGFRGAEKSDVDGAVAYGMWNVPKVNAIVLVGCIDGDKSQRFYMGGIFPQYLTHTMPHGRYTWADDTRGTPDGPLDSFERAIEPLYSNFTQQFTMSGGTRYPKDTPNDPRRNMEWRTRGVDTQVSAVNNLHINHPQDAPGSRVADHDPGNFDFTTVEQEDGTQKIIEGPGYARDQQEPEDNYTTTGGVNYDSHVYSWTTPGFHSLSMDDRHWNNRVRIRTASGHQILMDDTNERIYISTAGGNTWVELDKVGNVDVYAAKNMSFHAEGDINFTTDKSFRVHAAEGIHMFTRQEIRLHSDQDCHIKSEMNIRTHSEAMTLMQSEDQFHVKCVGNGLFFTCGGSIESKAAGCYNTTSGTDTNIRAGGNIIETGTEIHLNGPSALGATSASSAGEKHAFWTTRVPEHEPWGRVFMDLTADQDYNNKHNPEYDYTQLEINTGSEARGDVYTRNDLWSR